MALLKLLIILVLVLIALQDLKERAVYWFLFPLVGGLLALLHFGQTSLHQYIIMVGINILLVSLILLILYLYTKLIANQKFLNVSFGLGDLLFFYAFALGYPTYTFLLLFIGSILFSFVVFLVLKSRQNLETIPLAGLMGIFLIGVTVISSFPNVPSLYII